jgi:hypothetical protein
VVELEDGREAQGVVRIAHREPRAPVVSGR